MTNLLRSLDVARTMPRQSEVSVLRSQVHLGMVYMEMKNQEKALQAIEDAMALVFDGRDWVANALAVSPRGAGTFAEIREFEAARDVTHRLPQDELGQRSRCVDRRAEPEAPRGGPARLRGLGPSARQGFHASDGTCRLRLAEGT